MSPLLSRDNPAHAPPRLHTFEDGDGIVLSEEATKDGAQATGTWLRSTHYVEVQDA